MKSIFTLIPVCLVLILISFAPPKVDESFYKSKYITYSVERVGSEAILQVDVENIEQYDQIYLKRSDNPTDDFRQVKLINKSQIPELAANQVLTDKYPLPGNTDSYYKVIAISKDGIYKLFPCVKLSRY